MGSENRTQQKSVQKHKEDYRHKKIDKKKVEGFFKTNRSKDAWMGLKTVWIYQKWKFGGGKWCYKCEVNSFVARVERHDFS